jgi:hypothetical protein
MFAKPRHLWDQQLALVVDVSGLRSMQPLCLRLNHCLAVEVRNTHAGGALTFKQLKSVLNDNYHAAQALSKSADVSVANITRARVAVSLSKLPKLTVFARGQAKDKYSVPKIICGPQSNFRTDHPVKL